MTLEEVLELNRDYIVKTDNRKDRIPLKELYDKYLKTTNEQMVMGNQKFNYYFKTLGYNCILKSGSKRHIYLGLKFKTSE